ncbi:type I 3-dehydroquinate dehydratase [Patescibacteria group bacterium]|nr:type I 3-dehydroquinate dehydratase [Patescibacteria group bacterium]
MICASIREQKMGNVLGKIAKIPSDYDLIEVWVNKIEDFNLEQLMAAWKGEMILKITDISNFSLIKKINSTDAITYIDIDLDDFGGDMNLQQLLKKHNAKLILSYHDFEATPPLSEAKKILQKGKDLGADICKIIFTANSFQDTLVPFELLKTGSDIITFCMGEFGKLSRIYAPHLGCRINFVAPNEDFITADGQLTLDEWKAVQSALPSFEK